MSAAEFFQQIQHSLAAKLEFMRPFYNWLTAEHWAWSLLGFAAAALFSGRFLLQWYVSERLGKSVIPVQFWYFSLGGGILYFIYALHVMKWPVILMAAPTAFIAWRNLQLIRKHHRSHTKEEEGTEILEEPEASEESTELPEGTAAR